MSAAKRSVTRLFTQGLQIDAECGESGVVNLVTRADQMHKSALGRLRQHLAHALWRAGNLCDPSNHHHALRVVELVVPSAPTDDFEAYCAAFHVIQRWPVDTANGESDYKVFLIHEGVKSSEDRLLAARQFFGRQKGADDAHGVSSAKSPIVRTQGGTK